MIDLTQSRIFQQKLHRLIPGGCHTYAKGDDQFPFHSPCCISHGKGAHVWDVDGNRFIEYGMGCRAVSLGHAFDPIMTPIINELGRGTNFTRPSKLEAECAELLCELVPSAEMCKFSKNGSDATTAAIKLSRAHTGRPFVAICSDHPFFSIDDWFIGTTEINAGIPEQAKELTLTFRYNDPESLSKLFDQYPNQIACVILEPAKYSHPEDNFLHRVKEICKSNAAIFILDEMITGLRLIGYYLQPFLPQTSEDLANIFVADKPMEKGEALFMRLQ